jgi:hypothetical protein
MTTACRDENSITGTYFLLRHKTHKTDVNKFIDALDSCLGDWNELQNDLSSEMAVGVRKCLGTSYGVNMKSRWNMDRFARLLAL